MRASRLLINTLISPKTIRQLTIPDWELLIRQARASQLLARLAVSIREESLESLVPASVQPHLNAAMVHQTHLRNAVRNEVAYIGEALDAINVRVLLLKGAAYELAGLLPARCRTFNDIDLLVPKERINEVELSLLMHGWASIQHDAYDDRYYRTWMHEIPPLRHLVRHSVIDVHHNIVPDSGTIHLAARKLLEQARPCLDAPAVFVLSAPDMILHSAVHLFNDGEFDHALRDLFDIRDLIHQTMLAEADWLQLISRAEELELGRHLYYALRYLGIVLEEPHSQYLELLSRNAPNWIGLYAMDQLFTRGLKPKHSSCDNFGTSAARFSLYVRGHALRMPLHLLLPHLARKAFMQLREKLLSQQEPHHIP